MLDILWQPRYLVIKHKVVFKKITTKNMENTNKKLAVVYCRVSTEDQAKEGLSLDVQERVCTKRVREDKNKLLKVIRDEGKSGSNLKRAGMKEIISLIVNKKVDIIYALSSDRLARNTYDYLYLRKILKDNGIELRYISQPNGDDSAIAKTMDTVLASFNEFHSTVTSEKVKKSLGDKAEAGYFPSKAPIGYLNIENPDKHVDRLAERIIVPDPERAPFITEAFKLYATGNFNGYDLCNLMYEKGFRTKKDTKLAPSRFYSVLKNSVYTGKVSWGAIKNIHGKHQAIVDEVTFNQAQEVMAKNNYHACRRRKYQWLLNGFLYCARHDKRYTAEWHMNKNKAYYHCANKAGCGKYLEMNDIESRIADKFRDLEFNQDFINQIIVKAKAKFYEQRKEHNQRRQNLVNKRTALEAKRKMAEDKLLEGAFDNAEFGRIKSEVKEEIDQIEETLNNLLEEDDVNIDIAEEIIKFTTNIYQSYQKADQHIKRQYLGLFWDRFYLQDGVIIKTCPTLLFEELTKLEQIFYKSQKTKNPQINGGFSTAPNGYNKAGWLGDRDSNPGPIG